MRIIILLISVLITGFLVKQQLDSRPSNTEPEAVINNESITVPKVPTAAEDVEKFRKDINKFMLETNDKRMEEIDNL